MKRLIYITAVIVITLIYSDLNSQTKVFHEDFESPSGPDSVTTYSSSATNNWGISSQLSSSGQQSDSAKCSPNDTLQMTTNVMSTSGNAYVTLEFDHICKIESFDKAIIEVSPDNGVTWTKLDSNHYMGNSTDFGSNGNVFNASAYGGDWQAGQTTTPDSTWWKHETFNISSVAADTPNVKVRFTLIDANGSTIFENYGWFLDDIEVMASPSEMVPPQLSMLSPIVQDTINYSLPQTIRADITDNTGVDSAYVVYSINGTIADTLGMTNTSGNTYKADIPFVGFGRTVTYFVKAVDKATIQNTTTSSNYTYYLKYDPGTLQNVALEEHFNSGNIPGNWSTSSNLWSHETGSTNSFNTGPNGPYEGSGYVYTEASNGHNVTDHLESPQFNISNHTSPSLIFYYHMYGANMGTLAVEVNDGSGWQQVWSRTGQQHNSESAPWSVDTIDLSSYKSVNTQIRFKGTTGSSFQSDMAVDYVRVGETAGNIVNDAGIQTLVNPMGGVVANSNFDVKTTVKNYGGNNLTKFDVEWTMDGNAQTTYNWTGNLDADSVSSVINLGTKNVSQGAHSLKLWTSNPNDTADFNLSNDTLYFNFYGCQSLLSGTYTIGGTNPDYNTFSDAVLALSQCGVKGPVTFNVAPGVYNEQISIPSVNGVSASDTIVFQSQSNDSTAVTLQYNASSGGDNYVVELDGASYIDFRNMTFKAQNNSYPRVFLMKNNAHDITLSGNRFLSKPVPQGQAGADSAVVFVEDTLGDNFTFRNNRVEDGAVGMEISGQNNTGVKINHNEFIDQWAISAVIDGAKNPEVNYNYINTNSQHDDYNGIILANTQGNFEVAYNEVYADSSVAGYGIQLNDCKGNTSNPARIYNNMVLIRGGGNVSSTIAAGILNYETEYVDYYFNTVKMTGNYQYTVAMCLYDNTSGATHDIVMKDNILSNFANGNVFYTQTVNSSDFSNDYNNLYEDGSGDFASLDGTTIADFSGWQNQTGGGSNSANYDPYFPGGLDIHTKNNLLNATGTPISGINDDIDGDSRNATNPDIGADEFDPSPYDLALVSTDAPTSGCGLDSTENVTINIKNVGSAVVDTIEANYKIDAPAASVITENIYTSVNPGDTLTYTFNQKVNLDITWYGKDSTFKFKSWVQNSKDPIPNNDSAGWLVNSKYQPPAPVVSDTSINYGDSVTLTAVSNDTLFWYAKDTSTTELQKGNHFTTPVLYDSTTYWVEASATTSSPIMITEFSTNPDDVEIQNVSDQSFDATGWQVYVNDGGGINNPVSGVWNLGMFKSKEVKAAGDSYNKSSWPNLAFYDEDWVMIIDDKGNIKDFVVGDGYSTSDIQSMNVSVGGFSGLDPVSAGEWSGPGVNRNSDYARRMTYDSDDASDWVSSNSGNFGQPNQNMTQNAAFSSVSCPSARVPITVYMNDYPMDDAGVSAIVNPKGSVSSGVKQPVKVELHNYGKNNLQSADITWSLDGQVQSTLNWTGNIPYKGVDTVTVDSIMLKGGVFDVTAWSSQPNGQNDTVNTNDTASVMFNACMSGNYTIGDTTGGNNFDFISFTEAINAMNIANVCGDITFKVDKGTYNEQLSISPIPGVDANNTVTFTSMSGDSTDVIQTYPATSQDKYTLKFDGADYITFSNMTIEGTGNNARVVTFGDKAHHNQLLNNVIDANGKGYNHITVYSGSGASSNYNTIKNNYLLTGERSIHWRAANTGKGNVFENNIMENFSKRGIYLEDQDSIFVIGNTITTNSTINSKVHGIYADGCDRTHVLRNKIVADLRSDFYAIHFDYSDGTAGYPAIIANNFISVNSIGAYTHRALYIENSENLGVYYNSVNITGGNSNSAAAYLDVSSSYSPVNFKNNNLQNAVGYVVKATDVQGISSMDYNNYHTNSGILSEWDGTIYPNLSLLQNASGMDSNSVSLKPDFISDSDLHLVGTQLADKGTPIGSVTRDIDGDKRDALNPSIGADERILASFDAGVLKILTPGNSPHAGKQKKFKVVIQNFGLDTINSMKIKYNIDNQGDVTQNYNQSLLPLTSDTVSFPDSTIANGHHDVCFRAELTADTVTYNDKKCKHYYGVPKFDVGIVSLLKPDTGVCYTNSEKVVVKVKNFGYKNLFLSNHPVTIHAEAKGPNPKNFSALTLSSGIIPNGGTQNVSITSSYDMSQGGLYTFNAYPDMSADGNHTNDTMPTQSMHVNSIINSFPFNENFESFTTGSSSDDPGNFKNGWSSDPHTTSDAYQWMVGTGSTPTSSTGPDVDHTKNNSNGKYFYTESSEGSYKDEAKLISPCIDLRNMNNPVMRFWYYMFGADIYSMRIDINPGDGWHNSVGYILSEQQTSSSDPWEAKMVDLSQFAGNIIKVRFRGVRGPSSGWLDNEGDMAIDDILIYEPNPIELSVKKVKKPDKKFAMVGNLEPTEIVIENLGIDTVRTFQGGFYAGITQPNIETWNGTLPPFQEISYSFNSPYPVKKGNDPLKIFVNHPDDQNPSNDTMKHHITGFGTVNIPDYKTFEGEKYWRGLGLTDQWERGVPSAPVINSAYSGSNVWAINLDSSYAQNSSDLLYTPYYDFSSVQGATLELYHWYETEADADGGFIQYTQSFGGYWQALGTLNDSLGTNWYNSTNGVMYIWSGSSSGWTKSTYDLSQFDNSTSPIQFRFSFTSDNSNNDFDGWALGHFAITLPKIQKDAGVVKIDNPKTYGSANGQNVKVEIVNYGTSALTSIPLEYTVNGGSPVSETWTGNLAPGDTAEYSFSATLSTSGAFTLCAKSNISGDSNTFNDETCKDFGKDAKLDYIMNPLLFTYQQDSVFATVRITNEGSDTLTSMDVFFRIKSNPDVTEQWTGTIPPGGQEIYSFNQGYVSPSGSYQICAGVNMNGDTDASNDESCKYVTGKKNVSIPDKEGQNFMVGECYPNPAGDRSFIPVETNRPMDISFELYDLTGKKLISRSRKLMTGRHKISVDVKEYSQGMYFYKIKGDGHSVKGKLIISR